MERSGGAANTKGHVVVSGEATAAALGTTHAIMPISVETATADDAQ